MSQLDLFAEFEKPKKSTIAERIHERAKTAKVPIPGGWVEPRNKPLAKRKGLSGDLVSNIKERIRKRNHEFPGMDWLESSWHHGVFDDNTGYDVAMLILLDVPKKEIIELFKRNSG